MAMHSSIGEYHPNVEEWSAYAERLEHCFIANEVVDGGNKRTILLSVLLGLIHSLVSSQKAPDFLFTEIMEKVNRYHNLRPLAVVQWFKFNLLTRRPGEMVAAYVVELRKLSEFCEFADTLDEMLRDHLVWRIAGSRIQHGLLAEGSLTFPKALEIVQAMVMATRDLKDLQTEESPTQVNKLQRHKTPSTPAAKSHTPCYHCGRIHAAGDATR